MSTVAPYGTWASPLSPAAAAAGRRSRSGLASDGRRLYWLESRPEQGGRTVLVRAGGGATPSDVTPAGVSVRSRVYEYGGGAWCLVPPTPDDRTGGGPAVAYVDQADQRVWLLRPDDDPPSAPEPRTELPPPGEAWRHGDLRATPDGRWILAVRERVAGGHHAREVVAVPVGEEPVGEEEPPGAAPAGAGEAAVLCAGRDFFAAPRPDPAGRRLAWICWDHPDMPWDTAELWVAELRWGGPGAAPAGRLALGPGHRVAGGRGPDGARDGVSVGQPLWCADGSLVFAADDTGWWQPWRWTGNGPPVRWCDDEAEFHGPDWALGQATMAELPDGSLACRRRQHGRDDLVVLRPDGATAEPVGQPCVAIGAVAAHDGGVAWLGATPTAPATAWWWGGTGTGPPRRWGPDEPPLLDPADVSLAEPFTVEDAPGGPLHGLYYPPTLTGTEGPAGCAPPLVVTCHGGPTGNAEAGFDPVVQLLTSRGFAVAAVDYAGSTGYGRAYRQRLWGTWGEADVDDCVGAARWLAATGRADPARLAVRGASAGGFTALCALARADAFAGAVSWYGVTDLLALASATHDFESHYTDRLVGPLPAAAAEHRRRSPRHRVDEMSGAVLVLQGLDDPVVPPGQATAMVEALRRRGLPCRYLAFPGESHGFRRAATLEASLVAELDFYRDILCGP